MIITHKLTVNLTQMEEEMPCIQVVQGDNGTRAIEFALMEGKYAYEIPDGVAAAVRFRKPDGTGGVYSTMPDGSSAYSIVDSVLTVLLAPQVLACPGTVILEAALTRGGTVLGMFPIRLWVEGDPSLGTVESENYFSFESLEALNTAMAGYSSDIQMLNDHTERRDNPHWVTLSQLGGAPAAALERRFYTAAGEILTSRGGTARGVGRATIQITPDGVARIDFAAKITDAGTASGAFSVGPSMVNLQSLNLYVPEITPIPGGVCTYYDTAGALRLGMNQYGGTFGADADNRSWVLGRIYNPEGNFGAWQDSAFVPEYLITGTCFGTVELR